VTWLQNYLKQILDRDVVYIGASAGCTLPMPDFGLTWWEPGDPTDHEAFGYIDFIVAVHCKEEDKLKNIETLKKRRQYMQTLMNFPWRIYLVKDGQAIKVDADKVEHIGPGEKQWI